MSKTSNKPTEEQAQEFDQYVEYWQGVLSLQHWRIERGRKPAKDAMASVEFDTNAKLATYRLGDFGGTEITSESLSKTALHEILHVLLQDFMVAAKDPRTSDDQIEALEHGVINILEKVLYDASKIE
jgi:hypothetical protein